jgi:predicted esterase
MSTAPPSSTTSFTSSSSASSYKGAVIFLHGLGDGSPNGWEVSLEQQLTRYNPHLSSQHILYVFPNAPILPISINGGSKMPGWFDLYDWPIDLRVQDDIPNIRTSITTVNNVITKCMTEHNLERQQIVIGGFSQGGAIALLTAFHPTYGVRDGIGACINLSGWLPLRNDGNSNSNNNHWEEALSMQQKQNIPLFWGHGQYDEVVLSEHQEAGLNRLKQMGVSSDNIVAQQYPMGHSSDPSEMKAVADFIHRILFQNKNVPSQSDEGGTTASTSVNKSDEL